MIDNIFQNAMSNTVLSLGLAIIALIVGIIFKRPPLTYLIWLIVLVKLIIPPILTISIVTTSEHYNESGVTKMENSQLMLNNANIQIPIPDNKVSQWHPIETNVRKGLFFIWIVGCLLTLVISLCRTIRFNNLLRRESVILPGNVQSLAQTIAQRLKLKSTPLIYSISSNIPPMVWWTGADVKIIFPERLLKQLNVNRLQRIMAHELAHVRRKDYMVRWFEWIVSSTFWWNPVMYWARYNLRHNEELCCDAMVISLLNPSPRAYADSLLKAFENLIYPIINPPAVASKICNGDLLKRRLKMIVSCSLNRRVSLWISVGIILICIMMLSLGFSYGKNQTAFKSSRDKYCCAINLNSKEHIRLWRPGINPNDYKVCFEVLYPVKYFFPNQSMITITSQETAIGFFTNLIENLESQEKLKLHYPIKITYGGDSIVIIKNDMQMTQVREACCIDGTNKGYFEYIYPLSCEISKSSIIKINNKYEEIVLISLFKSNSDISQHPLLRFPVRLKYKDNYILTINNSDEMNRALNSCRIESRHMNLNQ